MLIRELPSASALGPDACAPAASICVSESPEISPLEKGPGWAFKTGKWLAQGGWFFKMHEELDEYDSDDTWESDLESEAEIAEIMQLDIAEDTSNTGKKEYLAKCAHMKMKAQRHAHGTLLNVRTRCRCSELKIVPVAMFIAKLDCEHINLRHHGEPCLE